MADTSPDSGSSDALGLSGVPGLLTHALGSRYPRLNRAAAAGVMGLAAYRAGREFVRRKRSERLFYVSVSDRDELFELALEWVAEHMNPGDRKSLLAQTAYTREWSGKVGEFVRVPAARFTFSGDQKQTINVDGFVVRVEVEQDNLGGRRGVGGYAKSEDSPASGGRDSYINFKLRFSCKSEDARRAVQRRLETLYPDPVASARAQFFTATPWGSWKRNAGARPRSLDSVILRGGLRDELVSDVDRFLRQEDAYERWSLPWHRGYLLHGLPGTGKTSIAAALAWHFNLNVYYLSLASVKNDDGLLELLSDLRERSMLIIEDVDVVRASHERTRDDDTDQGVTLGGLINALDGLVTPHGMITLMTTNRLEVLDPALVRSGRVDVKREIACLDRDQLERLCAHFLGFVPDDLPTEIEPLQLTAADVMGALKRHFEDPQAGARALVQLLTDGVQTSGQLVQ